MNHRSLISKSVSQNITTFDLTTLDKTSKDICFDCLIILNNKFSSWMLEMMVNRAANIVASDGGANLLFNSAFRDTPNLKAIVGDLDSLSHEARGYYSKRLVEIVHDKGQDNNDF